MPNVISLFTGAGGLDLGLEAAGFALRGAVEMNGDAVRTLKLNRPDWRVIHRDISEVPSEELLELAELRPREVDLLAGGPPCQPFSKSGFWKTGESKRLEDPRAATLHAYMRVLRDLQPKVFLLENVPGIAFNDKSEGLQYIRETVETINAEVGTNYKIAAQQMAAVEYGVPQLRERVFVIGHRDGLTFEFPAPTHSAPPKLGCEAAADPQHQLFPLKHLLPPMRTWDAIGHLEDDGDPALAVRGKWADLLPSIPEGCNYLFHTERGDGEPLFGWRRRYWSMLLKLAKDRPAWTLTAQPGSAIGPFHWKSRRLSAREMCALQTFPATYEITGSLSAATKQVGNAVPSLLTEILGGAIRSQLLGQATAESPQLTLLPKRRGDLGKPEAVQPVAAKYLALAGDHDDHPGTGLGPGAIGRRPASQEQATP